jgi:tyrosine-protein phosphatase YwqE
MLFNIFKTKSHDHAIDVVQEQAFAFLGTDIHSHLIPGIDDGSKTMEDSIRFIEQLQKLGFRNIVTTPHIKWGHFQNTRETISWGLSQLNKALEAKGIDISVRAAAEYYIDDFFLQLLQEEPLLVIRDNEVLVELSFYAEPFRVLDIFFKIQTAGYKPVLAHPERYAYYHDRKEMYRKLKEMGVLLQLNLLAITGHYGKQVQSTANWLLEEQLYDYCATDLHHENHLHQLQTLAGSKQLRILQQYDFLNAKVMP